MEKSLTKQKHTATHLCGRDVPMAQLHSSIQEFQCSIHRGMTCPVNMKHRTPPHKPVQCCSADLSFYFGDWSLFFLLVLTVYWSCDVPGKEPSVCSKLHDKAHLRWLSAQTCLPSCVAEVRQLVRNSMFITHFPHKMKYQVFKVTFSPLAQCLTWTGTHLIKIIGSR